MAAAADAAAAAAPAAPAANAAPSASVHTVRVHPDGAQVVRRVSHSLEPRAVVTLRGLADSAEAFYVTGGAVSSCCIASVSEPLSAAQTDALRRAAEDCDAFLGRARALDARKGAAEQRKKLLVASLEKQAEIRHPRGAAGYSQDFTDKFVEYVDRVQPRCLEVTGEECAIDADLDEFFADYLVLLDRLQRLLPPQPPVPLHRCNETAPMIEQLTAVLAHLRTATRKTCEVTLTAGDDRSNDDRSNGDRSNEEDEKIELSYVVRNVAWTPRYEVHCENKSEDGLKVTLRYFADVRNLCGEDWQNVQVSLERSNVRARRQPPQCPVTEVDFEPKQESCMRMFGAPANGVRMRHKMAAPRMLACSAMVEMDGMAAPPEENAGIAASFVLEQKVSLPSQPAVQSIMIAERTLDKSEIVNWAALEDPETRGSTYDVQRVLYAVNTTGFEMLPADANVFVDGEFRGIHPLDTVRVNRAFQLPLGCDPQLSIVERPARCVTHTGGIFSNGTSRTYSVRYAIKNAGREPRVVYVAGNVAVTTDTAAKVTLTKPQLTHNNAEMEDDIAAASSAMAFKTCGAVRNSVTGNVIQKFTVGAENALLDGVFEFTVSAPQGREIELVDF